ncbi:MAG: 6,7-dimethyl-8-ribityllumazine synthase [Acidimicrobiia bacterium]|nr:6,7-dimethyl-8-ribityllumazine synthase [Acidimicrobiia bacterium]
MGSYSFPIEPLDASTLRIAVVVSRFNDDITGALLDGALSTLREAGLPEEGLTLVSVPGAFELPVTAKALASRGDCDAVICLGAVIRGDTPHFDYVAGEAAAGLMDASLYTGIPIIFGVLTVDTRSQAIDRVGGSEGHKGEEAAATAIEMANLIKRITSKA